MNSELERTREQLDEEQETKAEFQRQVFKLNVEIQQWKNRYESEGLARGEELEEAKRKFNTKLSEAEEQVELALSKCNALEKVKNRLQNEVENLLIDVERANASAFSLNSFSSNFSVVFFRSDASNLEKKQKQFDKLINEWKSKCDDMSVELDASQKESRAFSTEVFQLKSQYEEAQEQIEALRKENQNLTEEIKDLLDQLNDGGKTLLEMDKSRKRAELEKEELRAALEEAETTLEQEESKVLRFQLEFTSLREDFERKLRDKDEDFENTRRNHAKFIESVKATMDAEIRLKMEALKQVWFLRSLPSSRRFFVFRKRNWKPI